VLKTCWARSRTNLKVWFTNLTHERTTRVTEACITTTTIKPRTKHVVSDPVQWQEKGPFAAFSCWDDWQLHFLQSVRWNMNNKAVGINILHEIQGWHFISGHLIWVSNFVSLTLRGELVLRVLMLRSISGLTSWLKSIEGTIFHKNTTAYRSLAWILSWGGWIQYTYSHSIFLRSWVFFIILLSTPRSYK
jgi:hypothetical protein